MNDQDINAVIKKIFNGKLGKMLSVIAKGSLYILIAFAVFFLIFAILDISKVRSVYESEYPLSQIIQKNLFRMSDASVKFNIVDFSAFFISFFIWLGILIGEGVPVLFAKYIKNHSEKVEYQPRNYLMYLLLLVEAMAYALGYYKFWGISAAWGYILIRFICAGVVFLMANRGIQLLVIGYNPALAVILNILSISCLVFAFMFAFYRFIVIPIVIAVINAAMGEIADNFIFFFWI